MIHGFSSDLPTFKSLTFRPGLNILLADKSAGATDRQSRNGAGPSFWVAFGGMVYVFARISLLLSLKFGSTESSELVLVIAHTPIRFSLGAKFPVSEPSPNVELRKYSVPPLPASA